MSSYQESDSKIASFALQALRSASEKIPSTVEKERIGRILKKVKDANKEISKCEKSYQNQADVLNKTIAHSVSSFVDRQLLRLERGMSELATCDPSDEQSVEQVYQQLFSMKEKLVFLYDLVSRWGWSHLRQVQRERIAEMYEKINESASQTALIFADLSKKSHKKQFLEKQKTFHHIVQFGSDRIKPDQIFSEA